MSSVSGFGTQESDSPKAPQGEKQAPGFSNSQQEKKRSLLHSSLSEFDSFSTQSPQLSKFVERMEKEIPGAKVVRIPEPSNTLAVMVDNMFYVLLFPDMGVQFGTLEFKRKAFIAYFPSVRKRLEADFANCTIIQNAIVIPEDYQNETRVGAIIAHLRSTFSANKPGNLDVYGSISFFKGSTLTISTSLAEVHNYYDRHWPFVTKPRFDYGIVVSSPVRDELSVSNNEPTEPKQLFVVGGYTSFVRTNPPNNSLAREKLPHVLAPIVHISSVFSIMPINAFAPLAIGLGGSKFLYDGLWLSPYTSFESGKPNLGRLMPDVLDNSRNELMSCDNMDDVKQFVQIACLTPVLAIDNIPGVPTLSMLKLFMDDGNNKRVIDAFSDFMGKPYDGNSDIFSVASTVITGIVNYPDSPTDSRVVDYMSLVSGKGYPAEEISNLLDVYENQHYQASIVAKHSKFIPLSYNIVSILKPSFVQALVNAINNGVTIKQSNSNTSSSNTNWLIDMAKGYSEARLSMGANTVEGGLGGMYL
jgi:hypothetical protein